MRVYLCAQFKEQELMREWRRLLHNAGHLVTSRWLDHTEEKDPVEGAKKAQIDLEDIENSDVVISHTLNRGDMFTGGGRHWEAGYAFARKKGMINVGGVESVFHYLVTRFDTIEEAIQCLR